MSESPKLSKKHSAFVDEYLRLFNGTRAYLRVYKRASYNTARANASKLLANADIAEAIRKRLEELHMGADETLKLLADMARSDVGAFMDVSTVGWNIDLLQRDDKGELMHDAGGNVIKKPETKLIKKLKQKVTTFIGKKEDSEDREIIETEIELYDAQAALEKIGRHLDLFPNKMDVTSGGEKIGANDTDTRLEILRKLDSIATATVAGAISVKPEPSTTGKPGA